MPRIPLGEDLGQAAPRPGRGAANYNSSGGMDALGRLASIGADVAFKVKENQNQLDLAEAATKASQDLEQYVFELNSDTEYSTQFDRYQEFVKNKTKDFEQKFKNPILANEFKNQFVQLAFKRGLEVRSQSLQGQMVEQQAQLSKTLSGIAQISIKGDREQFEQSKLKALALLDQSEQNGTLTPAERAKQEVAFNNEVDRAKVRLDMMSDPAAALEGLKGNSYPGLEAEENAMFQQQAFQKLETGKARAKSEQNIIDKELVSDTILSLNNGYPVTDDEIKSAIKASQRSKINPEALNNAISTRAYIALPKATRDKLYSEVQGVQNAELKQQLEKADETIQRELEKDAMSYAISQGVVDSNSIDVTNPQSVMGRVTEAKIASDHYGKSISPLTDIEADMFVSALVKMTPQEKVGAALAWKDAPGIWEQLDKKNAGLFAMSGAIGDKEVMTRIFEGDQKIRAGLFQNLSKKDYLPAFDEYVEDVYIGEDRKNMLDAAIAHFVATTGKGEYDKGDFEKSIEAVSGGIARINGGKVELPRGLDEDLFEDYIDGFTPEMVQRFGGVWGMSTEEAAQAIRKGKIISRPGGRYAVSVDGGPNVLFTHNGQPFEFFYDDALEPEPRKGFVTRGQRRDATN